MKRDRESKKSRGYGFIRFIDYSAQQACLGAGNHNLNGRLCEVKMPRSKVSWVFKTMRQLSDIYVQFKPKFSIVSRCLPSLTFTLVQPAASLTRSCCSPQVPEFCTTSWGWGYSAGKRSWPVDLVSLDWLYGIYGRVRKKKGRKTHARQPFLSHLQCYSWTWFIGLVV